MSAVGGWVWQEEGQGAEEARGRAGLRERASAHALPCLHLLNSRCALPHPTTAPEQAASGLADLPGSVWHHTRGRRPVRPRLLARPGRGGGGLPARADRAARAQRAPLPGRAPGGRAASLHRGGQPRGEAGWRMLYCGARRISRGCEGVQGLLALCLTIRHPPPTARPRSACGRARRRSGRGTRAWASPGTARPPRSTPLTLACRRWSLGSSAR